MIPITLTQQMHTPNLKIIEWFFPDNGQKCRTNGRTDTRNHCSPSLCPLPTSSARTINVTMFNKRFLSPTDQKCAVSSMFFYYCSHSKFLPSIVTHAVNFCIQWERWLSIGLPGSSNITQSADFSSYTPEPEQSQWLHAGLQAMCCLTPPVGEQ